MNMPLPMRLGTCVAQTAQFLYRPQRLGSLSCNGAKRGLLTYGPPPFRNLQQGNDRQGKKITAVASGQGPRSYTEWCDKVYHAQKLPKKGSHRHATRVSTWGKKSGMAQEDLK
mmetsp:Transcript_52860/g.102034  ORF Transcript_52860/g.102034 Transcript_52860/m.102034 type:complete len:113 (-) Transcript_52860:135-473(-)